MGRETLDEKDIVSEAVKLVDYDESKKNVKILDLKQTGNENNALPVENDTVSVNHKKNPVGD